LGEAKIDNLFSYFFAVMLPIAAVQAFNAL
jgi:hypothetical protein